MSESKSADTVPGLGFKDKEKALDTLKVLDGRDPDYQKFTIKGLIRRANRTLSITKAEDKLSNIKDAIKVFEDWLKDFEKSPLSKENMAYLPLSTVEIFSPLQEHFNFDNSDFIDAYKKSAEGDYKRLRTVESADGEPTWDIVRNKNLNKLKKELESSDDDLWDDDGLPTIIHAKMILWAYSPEASKIKKNLQSLEEKIASITLSDGDEEEDKKESKKKSSKSDEKSQKRKSQDSSSAGGKKKKSSDKE